MNAQDAGFHCFRCGTPTARSGDYCRPCRAIYMRGWRKEHRKRLERLKAENAVLREQLQNVSRETLT